MCTKQTTVSHSSSESDINSLDAGLRINVLPAFGWACDTETFSGEQVKGNFARQMQGNSDGMHVEIAQFIVVLDLAKNSASC